MSVEIDPLELGFQRPFTQEVSQVLKIKNTSRTPVAFKVKTTAPKQYCVRPNSGRIEPGKEIEVSVLLQAMKSEPPMDARCKDKFLVQSVAITGDKEFDTPGSIWQHVDDAERSTVQEKKIRVLYLAADGSGAAATPMRNSVNGTSRDTSDNAPPSYRSPSPEEHFTPDTRRSVATPSIKAEDDTSARGTVQNTVAAVTAAAPSYDEIKAKLADAQATIASYANEGGLKLRKVAKGETENQTVNDIANRVQQNQGVPLQIVAVLCLLSFLLAYLFF